MAERIGLIGQNTLCTIGKPYSIPGLDPEGNRKFYVTSVNFFLIFLGMN